MIKNIEQLRAILSTHTENPKIDEFQKLFDLSDYLLENEDLDLRQGELYDLSQNVILELMSLRIGIAGFKKYDDQDIDLEIIVRQMNLLKRVVPDDKKMQKIVERIFRG